MQESTIMFRTEDLVQESTIMFRTEDLVQESKGKRALHPLQERHTQCDELSSLPQRESGDR